MTEPDRRPVGLIYTGGTFGMTASERGYVPSTDLPARVEGGVAGLHGPGMPAIDWLEHEAGPPINSGDVTPAFWHRLARTIRGHAAHCRGFVVIHGTDTLAWTGSALSFLLGDLGQPVIVTGASRPLGEPGSDAPDNLVNALRVIAGTDCTEVAVAFGRNLLRANRATKRHGTFDEPFSSPACAPIGHLGERIELRSSAGDERPVPRELPTAFGDGELPRVAHLAAYPGLEGSVVDAVLATGVRGLVLEAYPAGLGPGGDPSFVGALERASASGVVVGAVSQARGGRVRIGRYATSTPLAEAGVVGGEDMTPEAALAKLHCLLAADLAPEEIRGLFARNLQGELAAE